MASSATSRSSWARFAVRSIVSGAAVGTLVVLDLAFADRSLVCTLLIMPLVIAIASPIVSLACFAAVLGVFFFVSRPTSRALYIAGKAAAALIIVVIVSIPVVRIGHWAVAESGLSQHLISDGAIRRACSHNSEELLRFESCWNSQLLEGDARNAVDKLGSSIGSLPPAHWDLIGGPVYFPFAESRPVLEWLEKGIVLNSSPADGVDPPTPADWRLIRGRWFIYVDGSTEPGSFDVR